MTPMTVLVKSEKGLLDGLHRPGDLAGYASTRSGTGDDPTVNVDVVNDCEARAYICALIEHDGDAADFRYAGRVAR